jgi:hypothetical protein
MKAEKNCIHDDLTDAIAEESNNELKRPLDQIGLGDKYRDFRAVEMLDPDQRPGQGEIVMRSMKSPLEYMFYQSQAPIERFQYLAGLKFRVDYSMAMPSSSGVVNYDSMAEMAIEESAKALREFNEKTFRQSYAKTQFDFNGPNDSRIDAMDRLGALAAEISDVGFYMLKRVVGEEYQIKDVASFLGEDRRYVSKRFHEALTEAAAHYRLLSKNSGRNMQNNT